VVKSSTFCKINKENDNSKREVANVTKGHESLKDLSKCKAKLKSFFDWQSIVHHEFIPGGATVKDRYKEMFPYLNWNQCTSEVF
jgi:hypothetical protein